MPVKDRSAEWAKRKASGRCVECGAAREVGLRCAPCTEERRVIHRESAARKRERKRAEGVCSDCGRVPVTDRVYCDACREKRLTSYATIHRPKRIAAHKLAHRALKRLVFDAYGGATCACCGEAHIEFLSIDHINGDGAAHRKSIGWPKAGGNFYSWLKVRNFPAGFRVLCMNCNFALGHCGYCPHQRQAPC